MGSFFGLLIFVAFLGLHLGVILTVYLEVFVGRMVMIVVHVGQAFGCGVFGGKLTLAVSVPLF